MSSVQETNRYQRAIREMAKRGACTTAGLRTWLIKLEGIGCSYREASIELRAWRKQFQHDEAQTCDDIEQAILAGTAKLNRDSRKRVISHVLSETNWGRLALATDEAAQKARATIDAQKDTI